MVRVYHLFPRMNKKGRAWHPPPPHHKEFLLISSDLQVDFARRRLKILSKIGAEPPLDVIWLNTIIRTEGRMVSVDLLKFYKLVIEARNFAVTEFQVESFVFVQAESFTCGVQRSIDAVNQALFDKSCGSIVEHPAFVFDEIWMNLNVFLAPWVRWFRESSPESMILL